MFWKNRKKEREMDDQEDIGLSQDKGSVRKTWGFPCSPDIPARMKELADRLQVPVYALAEHALQLSAPLMAKMAEKPEEREELRHHLLENHVGQRTIEKLSRLDEEMADILDKERHNRFQMEAAVRQIIMKFLKPGMSPREIIWAIDYGIRCRIAVALGRPLPKDLPPEEE